MLQGGEWGGARLYGSFVTNWQVVRTSKDHCILKKTRYPKLRNLELFYIWEDSRVWAHWNHSFDMYLSYLGPVSCVFTTWVSSGLTVGSGCSLTAARWQVFFPFWVSSGLTGSCRRAATADECDILCLLIWQEIFHFSMERRKGKKKS